MLNINKEKAKEILNKYETNRALFNWCDEYKQWCSENIYFGCDSEISYILNKSYDDDETPFSYDDIDLFDIDKARERILNIFDDLSIDEEIKDFYDEINFKEYDINELNSLSNYESLKQYLNSLSKGEIKDICRELEIDLSECEAEVLQWVAISSTLSYWLEKQGEIILDTNYWGRQTLGQAYKMDYCIMRAFISILNNIVN